MKGWRRYRLVPAVASAWSVAALATSLPEAASWIGVAGWCATGAAVLLFVRTRGAAVLAVVVALAASAATASNVALAQPARAELAALVGSGGRAVEATATVVGKIERRADGDLSFDAVAEHLRVGPEEYDAIGAPIEVRVAASEVDGLHQLDVGSVVVASGSTWKADAARRAVIVVSASRGLRIQASPDGPAALAGELRRGLISATRGLPEPAAGLIGGLAVGDTSGVGDQLDSDMKSSSLSHLTAVSGANCALVVALAFGVSALAGAPRALRIAVALVVLGGFVVLVTPEPSVARAAVMAAVAMLAIALGRPAARVSVLALALTLLLIGDPWLSTSLGFALSATATASLLLLARPLAAGMERALPRALSLALAVPLAAQLACGPLLVLISPTVPLYGIVANLLAAPAAPIATIVGLAACLALPIPVVQAGLTAIAWLPAAWIAGTAQTFAALPGARIPWLGDWWGVGSLVAVGAATVILLVPSASTRRWPRRTAAAMLSAVVGVAGGGAALSTVAGPFTLPSSWAILACDVGQGDAVLLRSDDEIALIDTGPDPGLLAACLSRAGVTRIDLLVVTHYDADHVGGVDAILGRVDDVRHGTPATAGDERMLDRLRAAGAQVEPAHAEQSGELGTASWRVLWPRKGSRAYPNGNDASVVLEVTGGGFPHAVFLGDLSASPQRALAASGALDPPYELVKVAHHGSADQSAELYQAISPGVAIVTVGVDNDYDHPREETLSLLDVVGAVVARTDRQGFIAIWRTAEGVAVWREHAVDVGRPG